MSVASPFEVARSTHEESERYTSALSNLLNTLPSSSASTSSQTSRTALTNAHIASLLTDRIVTRNRNLLDFYTDDAGIKRDEDVALSSGSGGGESSDPSSSLSLFYSRLRHIQQHHEKYPAAPPETFELDLPSLEGLIGTDDDGGATGTGGIDRLFSGEEGAGRYLDLYEYHSQYINLKGVKRLTYHAYLDAFASFAHIGLEAKRQDAYRKYLASLLQYLVTYLQKVKPLDDIDALVSDAETAFEGAWSQGTVQGWEDGAAAFASHHRSSANGANGNATPATTEPSTSSTGIWCEACHKSFAKQTVFDAHLQGAKHKKAVERQQGGGGSSADPSTTSSSSKGADAKLLERGRSLARQEHTITTLATGALSNHINDTRSNVERRAALTERERAAEAEELARQAEERQDGGGGGASSSKPHTNGTADGGDGSVSDSDDEKIYNPKKLPLGWDGRPIPVWLYKLHGLGVEFSCEICSGHVYHGRKNFDRHFAESRHSFGMRALNLPNTKHFHGITSIQDALALADKLKKEAKAGGGGSTTAASAAASARDVEEVEDENGNTYSRKDYELLKRQGLI